MKKLLSMLLASSLLAAAGTPAFAAAETAEAPAVPVSEQQADGPAADTLDARLTAVTRAVKVRLSIGDEFTNFYGEASEDQIAPRWRLNWTAEGRSINVTAGEDGKVYQYSVNQDDSGNERFWGLNAAFPKVDREAALAAAQRFADSLLDGHESVKLEAPDAAGADGLTLTGKLLFNGLPSPVSIRVRLDADTLAPTYYRRSDSYTSTYPEVPAAKTVLSSEKAGALLRSTLQLKPYYVRSRDDRKSAELRYVLESEGNYVVTAGDGRLVDLTEVYSDLARSYTTSDATENQKLMFAGEGEAVADAGSVSGGSSPAAALSETELKSIESLRDVHTREQLDAALRAVPELGLGSAWTLERAGYSQDRDNGKVSATLRYTRPLTEDELEKAGSALDGELMQVRKNITLDARTDELQSVYTYQYYWSDDDQKQTDAQRSAAEAFLSKYLPEKWKKTARYERENDDGRLLYAQSVNGYLFRDNLISIQMGSDNTVERLSVDWDDEVRFGSVDGILSEEEAVTACFDAFEMPLGYIEYPVLENGVMAYRYVAAYAFDKGEDRYFGGIDAKTGEPVWTSYRGESSFAYDDLAGAFGRTQIEALAAYGVGLPGASFLPKAVLDQKSMLALLLSACGYECDPDEKEGLDNLYAMAYSENLVKAADRNPDAAVTRLGFLKTLLGASVYGEAAKVQGIYTCPFSDRAKVARADYGYAALAYGLGIARGDDKGRLNPDSVMTRQEAAVMLYNFMMR